jgi:hypothetical protein
MKFAQDFNDALARRLRSREKVANGRAVARRHLSFDEADREMDGPGPGSVGRGQRDCQNDAGDGALPIVFVGHAMVLF